MCLPRLGEIVSMADNQAVVEILGQRAIVDLMCVPEAAVGDHVMIHAGYALTVLTREEAVERKALMDAVRFGVPAEPAHPGAVGADAHPRTVEPQHG